LTRAFAAIREAAIPSLIDRLVDDNKSRRSAAAKILGAITEQSFGEDRKEWQQWWENNRRN
jgi:hypothetical protein